MNKKYLGIDIGNKGAIALIQDDIIIDIANLQTTDYFHTKGKNHKMVCPISTTQIIESMCKDHLIESACIEQPLKKPGQNYGIHDCLKRGISYGIVAASLSAKKIPHFAVFPATWKSKIGLTGTGKKGSLQMALNRFKNGKDFLRTVSGDNDKAEAALLATLAPFYKTGLW